jgi:hypothetical protein
MARKLKVYRTSLGFFDQAIAAPSMKAAVEAWGTDRNLFHQGAAKESMDPDLIAATMAKPGVVLKRAVGSDGPFAEHADLPTKSGRRGSQRPSRLRSRPRATRLRRGRRPRTPGGESETQAGGGTPAGTRKRKVSGAMGVKPHRKPAEIRPGGRQRRIARQARPAVCRISCRQRRPPSVPRSGQGRPPPSSQCK